MLNDVEKELNRMRAESLGDAGKKLELLCQMLAKEQAYQARLEKIQARLKDIALTGKKKKRKLAARLLERIAGKLDRSASYIRQMQKQKLTQYRNVILQREALGLTDHSWIDEFYM